MGRIAILLTLALAACASPQQQCVTRADRDYAGLLAAIRVAEGNIARGYAIEREVVPYRNFTFCTGTGFNRRHVGIGLQHCNDTRYRTISTPVPLDIEAEERKLASMRARVAGARERRNRAIAACYAAYPG